CTNGDSW
nr:immunoglobulin heavy chain junction region [Macaca mulatta]